MDADGSDELREIAGLAALASGAHVVALVPRSGGESPVGGPGASAAGPPAGAVHALQLARATVDLHVVARVPVYGPANVRLATLVAYARDSQAPTATQQAALGGFARLAGRALARAGTATRHRMPATAAADRADGASVDARITRVLARAIVREGRRTAARLRDDVASATSGSSLLLAALAGRLPALGARVVADAQTARAALDAATLACRQLAESQPAFVASGYTFHGALALYVAHLTRSRWPACTIDVAPDTPRELAADVTLLLLGLVAQATAIAQRRPGCRHLAIRVYPVDVAHVRLLLAADGAPAPRDVRTRRRLAVAAHLARHARAELWNEAAGDPPPASSDALAALEALRDHARLDRLAPVQLVTVPRHGRGRA